MRVSLSTWICPDVAAAGPLLAHWQAHARGPIDGISLDPRLSPALQLELLDLLYNRGLRCTELACAGVGDGGRTAPSALSDDRQERDAARRELSRTIERAARHGVRRVIAQPAWLTLVPSPAQVRRWRAEGREVELDGLLAQRRARRAEVLDRLCQLLDGALAAADRSALQLLWPAPAVWPHQAPDPTEVERLLAEFAGAPVASQPCIDWGHAAAVLAGGAAAVAGPAAGSRESGVRIADACALLVGLPIGSGEIDWATALADLDAAEATLTLASHASPAEVQRSAERVVGSV